MSEPTKISGGKRKWESPTIKNVGTLAETVKAGGGKLSVFAEDTGDQRKPKGQG